MVATAAVELRQPVPAVLSPRWRAARRAAAAVYAVVLATYIVRQGVPMDRLLQTCWILAALLITAIGSSWWRAVRILLEWAPFVGLLLCYDYVRGLTGDLGISVHEGDIVDAEKWLTGWATGGEVPTTWLQSRLLELGVIHWWDVVVSLVYATHFVLPWLLAAYLYARDHRAWVRYAAGIVTLSMLALACYALFPAAPPWMAAQDGLIGTVVRGGVRGWSAVGLHDAGVLLDNAQARDNLVAAMPSLHFGTTLFVTIVLWRRVVHLRWLPARVTSYAVLVCYPPAMAFSLVYAGEHYVVDVLAGGVAVAVTFALVAAVSAIPVPAPVVAWGRRLQGLRRRPAVASGRRPESATAAAVPRQPGAAAQSRSEAAARE
ncbi:MAG: phosphatase PAP2 family protein [Actinomycetes bacterium]